MMELDGISVGESWSGASSLSIKGWKATLRPNAIGITRERALVCKVCWEGKYETAGGQRGQAER